VNSTVSRRRERVRRRAREALDIAFVVALWVIAAVRSFDAVTVGISVLWTLRVVVFERSGYRLITRGRTWWPSKDPDDDRYATVRPEWAAAGVASGKLLAATLELCQWVREFARSFGRSGARGFLAGQGAAMTSSVKLWCDRLVGAPGVARSALVAWVMTTKRPGPASAEMSGPAVSPPA
jgi:hypothetical protein